MYKTILLTLDSTPTDRAIIEHIKQLAKLTQGRVILLHVADGWAARTFGPDAISPEITEDNAYLNRVRSEFQSAGIPAEAELAYGEPGDEIVKWIEKKGCDLVAMSTHGVATRPAQHPRARAPATGKMNHSWSHCSVMRQKPSTTTGVPVVLASTGNPSLFAASSFKTQVESRSWRRVLEQSCPQEWQASAASRNCERLVVSATAS